MRMLHGAGGLRGKRGWGQVAGLLWLLSALFMPALAFAQIRLEALEPAANALGFDEVRARETGWSLQPPMLRRSSGSQWWRLQVDGFASGGEEPAILSLRETYDGRLVAYLPPDYRPQPLYRYDPELKQLGSRHRLALRLDPAQLGQPVYLRVDWARSQPIGLALQPESDYLAEDLGWVRFTSAILATLLLLAGVGVLFALALRRRVLAFFCAWILSAAIYHLVMSGEVVWLLGPLTLVVPPLTLSGLVVHLGLLAAYVFVYRFLAVPRHFPRLGRLFLALLWAVGLLSVLTLLSGAAPAVAQLVNLLLLLLASLTLGIAFRLARLGDQQAWFYLVGWAAVAVVAILRAIFFLREQGTPLWLEYAHPAADAFGALVLVVAIARAARYAEREMHSARRSARTDPLTGLPNRAELDSSLPGRIELAERHGRGLCVLFIDLDHFKRINDRWGHDVGDLCLVAAAEVMRGQVRTTDLVARYGGEEFVLILDGAGSEAARAIAAELRAGMERHGREVGGHAIGLTVSIGVAERRPGEAAGDLLRRADEALYRAKAEGRNRYVVAESA